VPTACGLLLHNIQVQPSSPKTFVHSCRVHDQAGHSSGGCRGDVRRIVRKVWDDPERARGEDAAQALSLHDPCSPTLTRSQGCLNASILYVMLIQYL